jgi:hypothetical protein
MGTDAEVEDLYRTLMTCWNTRDADGYGALFTGDGSMVGFDGSSVQSATAVAEHLRGIFGDHETASYVWLVREALGVGRVVARIGGVVEDRHDQLVDDPGVALGDPGGEEAPGAALLELALDQVGTAGWPRPAPAGAPGGGASAVRS